jgi:CHAT domain-containing protein/Tfp pilus assembly protein PilF
MHAAKVYYTKALTIQEQEATGSLKLAQGFNALGVVALKTGDLQAAQNYFTRALRIQERLAPDSQAVAGSLHNLGNVARRRCDSKLARDLYTRSFDIYKRLAPKSLRFACALNSLGWIAYNQGDLHNAYDIYASALSIREQLAPDSLDVAASLNNLGLVAEQSGDLQAARDCHTRALAINEHHAPDSLEVAQSLNNLGGIAYKHGDFAMTKDYYLRALRLRERLAPGSLDLAESLACLGQTWLAQKLPKSALPYLLQAVGVIEHHRSAIGTPESRALLLAQYHEKYALLIQCFLALGRPADAFFTLERSRARSLLELLTDRQLDFTHQAPRHLLERQQQINDERAAAGGHLTRLLMCGLPDPQVDELLHHLRDLDRQQQELMAQLRAASPHYASLPSPHPLSPEEIQSALEPGDVLFSYFVGEQCTVLFTVTACQIQVVSLPLGRKVLQNKVQSLREIIDWRIGTNRTKTSIQRAVDLGRELYTDLIHPVASLLHDTKRLLFCPDGPLHILPVAALVTNPRGKPLYFGTRHPMKSILSATLFALQQVSDSYSAVTRSSAAPHGRESASPSVPIFRRILAFADPVYPANSASSPTRSHGSPPTTHDNPREIETSPPPPDADQADTILEHLQERGMSLATLPHTRTEVLTLNRLFGEAATVKLGAQATKQSALIESADADVLHFACHGFVDAEMPLNSGLVLSRTEATVDGATAGDNGLLQVWEIFQKLRLNAELVVLSACETGLGEEVRGEGLIGLTRAFHYAGARNLVVSLYEVNDESTSVFMRGFYEALKSGKWLEEAMMDGIAMVRSHPEWSSPYFWSGFVLIGGQSGSKGGAIGFRRGVSPASATGKP